MQTFMKFSHDENFTEIFIEHFSENLAKISRNLFIHHTCTYKLYIYFAIHIHILSHHSRTSDGCTFTLHIGIFES